MLGLDDASRIGRIVDREIVGAADGLTRKPSVGRSFPRDLLDFGFPKIGFHRRRGFSPNELASGPGFASWPANASSGRFGGRLVEELGRSSSWSDGHRSPRCGARV